MTLLEIYNNVAALVYGDIAAAPPPAHEVASMRSFILARHRDCQLGFNYWFQKVITTFPLVTGTTAYTWPDDFKELISLDTDKSITLTAAGFNFETEDAPTEDEDIDFTYWSILQPPAAWDDTHEDAVTIYLAWYIIYQATGDMYLKRGEKTDAQAYYQLADTAKFNAEREDFHRRQSLGVIF